MKINRKNYIFFFSFLRVGIEHTQGEGPGAYLAATISTPKPPVEEPIVEEAPETKDSDSDSDSN